MLHDVLSLCTPRGRRSPSETSSGLRAHRRPRASPNHPEGHRRPRRAG